MVVRVRIGGLHSQACLRHREQDAAARPASLAKLAESGAISAICSRTSYAPTTSKAPANGIFQRIDAQARASGKGSDSTTRHFRKGLRDPARNVTCAAPDFEVVSHAWEPPLRASMTMRRRERNQKCRSSSDQNPQVVRVVTDARGHRFSHSTIAV